MPVQPEPAYDALEIPEFTKTRDISDQVHAYLRHLIIDEVLPAGTTLNQAILARRLRVSRIPMREAFRMLQQEGLIDVQLNQRATIRGLSVEELEGVYGTRIALESLGARVTAGRLTEDEVAEGVRLLDEMSSSMERGDIDSWIGFHRLFHALCTARAADPVNQLIHSLSERTERYLRYVQNLHPEIYAHVEQEHREILTAIRDGDAKLAGSLMAEHLGHTARYVVKDLGGQRTDGAIHHAYIMATGRKRPRRRYYDAQTSIEVAGSGPQ